MLVNLYNSWLKKKDKVVKLEKNMRSIINKKGILVNVTKNWSIEKKKYSYQIDQKIL